MFLFSSRLARIILNSKSKYMGTASKSWLKISGDGVINAAAINIITNACFLYCLKNELVTSPDLASSRIIKGSWKINPQPKTRNINVET